MSRAIVAQMGQGAHEITIATDDGLANGEPGRLVALEFQQGVRRIGIKLSPANARRTGMRLIEAADRAAEGR